MARGKRKRDRQPTMWVTTTDLPTAASHPFYRRLNQLLREHGFDDFFEAQCASISTATMGLAAELRSMGPDSPPIDRPERQETSTSARCVVMKSASRCYRLEGPKP